MDLPADFIATIALYEAHVDTWGGFLFVNLDERRASTLTGFLGEEASECRTLAAGRTGVGAPRGDTLACNWKLFWENY